MVAAVLPASALWSATARAQDATWKSTPLNNDYNNSGNWNPAQVPTGIATFNTSSITALGFSAQATTIGGWTFNPGASDYTFTLSSLPPIPSPSGPTNSLTFTGAGIVINGGSVTLINSSSSIKFKNNSTAGSATIITSGFNGFTTFLDHSDGGTARFITNESGTLNISGLTSAGMSAGSIEGSGFYALGSKQLTVGSNNLSTTVSGVISGPGGSLVKVGTGTLTLSGINTYTGATTINSGTLDVDGSIATSNLTTVNNGALLTGIGTVGNLQINSRGIFAPGTVGVPGTAMTVAGNLTFMPGAFYFIYLNPANTTSATVVSSTATLNGTVDAAFANGQYMTRQFDILHASSITGTFSALDPINLPVGFIASLSYTSTDVFLDLTASLSTQGLNLNQLNVANAIDNFFNNGGALPPGFQSLFNLTGASLGNALTALDGENATGAEHAAFELMNAFLNLMLDANVDGRVGGGGSGGPIGFAPDQEASFPPDIALAYAGVLKSPPKQTFTQPWTAWASGFGGSARTNGDAIIGSNTVTTSTVGYAAGMDYHYSSDTVLGFALAGGGTSWNLAQGPGSGRSDAFMAGVYGVTHQGPAYVGGALAFANNWFTTNRTALGDQLTASFQGQSYAGRLEGGYRFALAVAHNAVGVTPYAAIQAQNFHTPAYSETDLTVGGFGLSYAAMNGTDTRSELGARFDDFTAVNAMPLILRARAAWAHDWVSNPALNASFQALPGAGFTVFGAPVPHDSALTSAGAQLFFTPHWSLLAKFDGEFAKGSQTYAGTGALRYTW